MKKQLLKCFLLILSITAFILALIAVAKSFSQEYSQTSNNNSQISHLQAQEFKFNAHVEFPSSVMTNSDKYTESITHTNNGAFDIILSKQGDVSEYLFRISSVPKQQCESDPTRACQQMTGARSAMGNIADIQIVLQGSQLISGTYQFGSVKSTLIKDVVIYSRQLYSDPSHGRLGCQKWGKGALNIGKAVYDVNGKLKYIEASLFRVCNQTVPFPPALPKNNLLQAEAANIEQYTYYVFWRCQLKEVAGE